MTTWLTEDEQRAWRGLMQMTSHLQSRLGRDLQEVSSLSHADYAVLVALSDQPEGRLRVIELSEALAWEQSRTSHQVSRMAKRGLVSREGCPKDRRGAFVQITDRGTRVITEAAPAHVRAVRRYVFDGLSPEQVEALGDITGAVLERLDRD